jgi:hypothetical protein
MSAVLVKDSDADHFRAAIAMAVVDIWNGIGDFGRFHDSGMSPGLFRLSLVKTVAGIFLIHRGEVFGDHHLGLAEFHDAAVIQPKRAIPDGLNV